MVHSHWNVAYAMFHVHMFNIWPAVKLCVLPHKLSTCRENGRTAYRHKIIFPHNFLMLGGYLKTIIFVNGSHLFGLCLWCDPARDRTSQSQGRHSTLGHWAGLCDVQSYDSYLTLSAFGWRTFEDVQIFISARYSCKKKKRMSSNDIITQWKHI